jgi:lipopolysaccharide/colanic/teichoic acid biosynthesis glycosyltransferase
MNSIYLFLKRSADLVVASVIILVLFFPVIIPISILLFVINKTAGVFFFQERTGKNGKHFKVIKFKTMTDEKDAEGKLLPDHQRITKVGRFVRTSSIDELPQLLNVIKGDMSLVGPRPLLPKYLPLYSPEQNRRHEVKPGITGWAQVNGRNAISWQEKFKLDVWYVDHQSFWLDMKILFLTVKKVLARKNIMPEDPATFGPFTGNNES